MTSDNIKEDLQQRGSDMRQAAERVKDRKQWKTFVHAAPSSAKKEDEDEDGLRSLLLNVN